MVSGATGSYEQVLEGAVRGQRGCAPEQGAGSRRRMKLQGSGWGVRSNGRAPRGDSLEPASRPGGKGRCGVGFWASPASCMSRS